MGDDVLNQEYNRRVQDESDEGVPNTILFVFCFFTIWNMIICIHTVKACSGLFRGQFNESAPTLFCPHWIVGIAIPMYVGYSWYGIAGLFLLMIPFVVPHCVGIAWLRHRNLQPRAPTPTLDATSDQNENSSDYQANNGDSTNLSGMTEEDRMEYLDTILITKKVVSEQSVLRPAVKSTSFRSRNPKNDIIIEEGVPEKSIVDQVFASVSGANDEESARICSICLEEYQVDEEVCWSKNPECFHCFHKNCLVDWLLTDKSCPNCRRSYVGDFSQDEPEP